MRKCFERQGIWVYDDRRTFVLLVAAALFTIMLGGTVRACEVIWVLLYVGETEDDATENSDMTLTLADGASEYWFRVRWKARDDGYPGGDNDFHVEVHDVTEDISLWEEEHIEDEDPGDTQQEVHEVDSPAQALQQGVHTLRAYAKRRDVGEWVESNDGTVYVAQADIAAFDRTAPSKAENVQITVSPSGATIELDVIMTSGTSGSATVSPSSITGTATVAVTGGSQTSVGDADNLSLRAKVGSTVLDTEAFSVCAHPKDFEAYMCNALRTPTSSTYYGVEVFYQWGSDSGSVSHLDESYLKESFSGAYGDTPPFYNVGAPSPAADLGMEGGATGDEQGYKKSDVHNYTDGTAGWDQELEFECKRCGETDTLSNNSTTFTVYDEPVNVWWIDAEVSTSCAAPSGGCGVVHAIP